MGRHSVGPAQAGTQPQEPAPGRLKVRLSASGIDYQL